MGKDWYPRQQDDLGVWHANFAVKAGATGLAHGLTAPQVAQIQADAAAVAAILAFTLQADAFAQAATAWKNLMFFGEIGLPQVEPPPSVTPPDLPDDHLPAIMARTRQYAAIVRASSNYSRAVGEGFGIVPPQGTEPGIPRLRALSLTQSQVELRIVKKGFTLAAIDSRRGGESWEPIGVSMMASFIDSRPPLVAGQPEVREYRAQGMRRNNRVGALSMVVSAVTNP